MNRREHVKSAVASLFPYFRHRRRGFLGKRQERLHQQLRHQPRRRLAHVTQQSRFRRSRLIPPGLDNTGKVLLVANYASGDVASFALKGEESIGERTGFDQPTGFQREPSSSRRTPAHEVVFSPGNRFLFVPDLGTDQIQDIWVDAGTITSTISILFAPTD